MREQLDLLNKNVDKLLGELKSLKEENALLRQQLKDSKSNGTSNNGSSMNIEEVESIKIQIDANIQEIDKCIEMISNR